MPDRTFAIMAVSIGGTVDPVSGLIFRQDIVNDNPYDIARKHFFDCSQDENLSQKEQLVHGFCVYTGISRIYDEIFWLKFITVISCLPG